MVSFDEQAILDNGAYIYNQRAEIERIADEICEKGFDSIFFTSSGGSLAMMQPFDYMVSVMSDIPVQSQVSADFLTVGNRRIGKGTLAVHGVQVGRHQRDGRGGKGGKRRRLHHCLYAWRGRFTAW